MAIELYTGFVGSGKSFCATKEGIRIAQAKLGYRTVLANFPVKKKKTFLSKFRKKKYKPLRWIYKTNDELTVKFLVDLSKEKKWTEKEGSALLIFDEASIKFNARTYQQADRMDWINFLSQSRKLGYDVIFITQDRRMLDRQIRNLCEYESVFKKLNNMFFFKFLNLFRISLFAKVRYWNGTNAMYTKGQLTLIKFNKKIADRYDTMKIFDDIA